MSQATRKMRERWYTAMLRRSIRRLHRMWRSIELEMDLYGSLDGANKERAAENARIDKILAGEPAE